MSDKFSEATAKSTCGLLHERVPLMFDTNFCAEPDMHPTSKHLNTIDGAARGCLPTPYKLVERTIAAYELRIARASSVAAQFSVHLLVAESAGCGSPDCTLVHAAQALGRIEQSRSGTLFGKFVPRVT